MTLKGLCSQEIFKLFKNLDLCFFAAGKYDMVINKKHSSIKSYYMKIQLYGGNEMEIDMQEQKGAM